MQLRLKGFIKEGTDNTPFLCNSGTEIDQYGNKIPYKKESLFSQIFLANFNVRKFGRVRITITNSVVNKEIFCKDMTINSYSIYDSADLGRRAIFPKTTNVSDIVVTLYDVEPSDEEKKELMILILEGKLK